VEIPKLAYYKRKTVIFFRAKKTHKYGKSFEN